MTSATTPNGISVPNLKLNPHTPRRTTLVVTEAAVAMEKGVLSTTKRTCSIMRMSTNDANNTSNTKKYYRRSTAF